MLSPHKPSGESKRANALVLVAVLMAVGLLFWFVTQIHHGVLYQNCNMAGFRNCVGDPPVITSPYRRDKLE